MAQNQRDEDHSDSDRGRPGAQSEPSEPRRDLSARPSPGPSPGPDPSLDPTLGQRAFGRDQSTGASQWNEQQRHDRPDQDSGRPAGGWQDPDRTYSAEARGDHQSHDPWSASRGYARFGYGDSRGTEQSYAQRYDEGQHPRGRYPSPYYGGQPGTWEGGYGRRPGGESYSGYGAQDEGWGGGDQGRGDYGVPPRYVAARPDQPGGHHGDHFDPEYSRWRAEQIAKLDDDYRAWRQERQSKFNEDFESWRRSRQVSGERAPPDKPPSMPSDRLPIGHHETMDAPSISGLGTSATGGANDRPTEDDLI